MTGVLWKSQEVYTCLLYTSDAADDLLCVDLGGRRIIKKKKTKKTTKQNNTTHMTTSELPHSLTTYIMYTYHTHD